MSGDYAHEEAWMFTDFASLHSAESPDCLNYNPIPGHPYTCRDCHWIANGNCNCGKSYVRHFEEVVLGEFGLLASLARTLGSLVEAAGNPNTTVDVNVYDGPGPFLLPGFYRIEGLPEGFVGALIVSGSGSFRSTEADIRGYGPVYLDRLIRSAVTDEINRRMTVPPGPNDPPDAIRIDLGFSGMPFVDRPGPADEPRGGPLGGLLSGNIFGRRRRRGQ